MNTNDAINKLREVSYSDSTTDIWQTIIYVLEQTNPIQHNTLEPYCKNIINKRLKHFERKHVLTCTELDEPLPVWLKLSNSIKINITSQTRTNYKQLTQHINSDVFTNLKNLDLSYCNIYASNSELIAPAKLPKGLTALNLKGNIVGDTWLNSWLDKNKTNNIKTLNLSGTLAGEKTLNLINTNSSTSKIEHLDLSFNRISTQSISTLKPKSQHNGKIKKLNLGNNSFNNSIWEILNKNPLFSDLEHLSLSNNKISNPKQANTQGLNKLLGLNLQNCQINDIDCEIINHIKKVKWLELHRNNISNKGLETILSQNKQLKYIGLGNTNISENKIHEILNTQNIKNLQGLDISYCNIKSKAIQKLVKNNHFKNIKLLNISNTHIETQCLDMILDATYLPELKHLAVGGHSTNEHQLEKILSRDTGLTSLFIDNTPQDTNWLQALKNIKPTKQLKHLIIQNCKITDAILKKLTENLNFKSLKILELPENEITHSGISDLINHETINHLEQLNLEFNPLGDKYSAP